MMVFTVLCFANEAMFLPVGLLHQILVGPLGIHLPSNSGGKATRENIDSSMISGLSPPLSGKYPFCSKSIPRSFKKSDNNSAYRITDSFGISPNEYVLYAKWIFSLCLKSSIKKCGI